MSKETGRAAVISTSYPFRRPIVVIETLVGLGGLAGSIQLLAGVATPPQWHSGPSRGLAAMRRTRIGSQVMRWATPALLIAYATVHRLGQTYGSTSHERQAVMPGDGIVPKARFVTTHGVTIDAPPENVWPRLVQMGLHRGGWYTARWVDKLLFPANRASVDHIIGQLQDLQVGDFIPDGPPETECGFVVEELEAPRVLVLHSTSHLPLEWRRTGKASIDWTWVFSVLPLDTGDRTRFIFRWRAATKPWWLTLSTWAVIVPADFIMSRDLLHGVKHRAEQLRRTGASA